ASRARIARPRKLRLATIFVARRRGRHGLGLFGFRLRHGARPRHTVALAALAENQRAGQTLGSAVMLATLVAGEPDHDIPLVSAANRRGARPGRRPFAERTSRRSPVRPASAPNASRRTAPPPGTAERVRGRAADRGADTNPRVFVFARGRVDRVV